jgi:hypothetical protein
VDRPDGRLADDHPGLLGHHLHLLGRQGDALGVHALLLAPAEPMEQLARAGRDGGSREHRQTEDGNTAWCSGTHHGSLSPAGARGISLTEGGTSVIPSAGPGERVKEIDGGLEKVWGKTLPAGKNARRARQVKRTGRG